MDKPKSNDVSANTIITVVWFEVKGWLFLNKEELKKYVPLMREAQELKKQAEKLEDEAKSLKAVVMDGMPKGSGASDSIGNIVVKIEQLRADYLHKYDLALCELYKIERVIEHINNETERIIMRKRYIQGLCWEDICSDMSYSWQHIHRIHSKILRKLK